MGETDGELLSHGEKFSIIYHNLFDYPMSFSDMIRWRANDMAPYYAEIKNIENKNGYFFVQGNEGIVYKKMLKKRISAKKMEIAIRVAKILSFIPSVKMIGVTGSLAMENASDESDIDFIIITKSGLLWTTRLFVYALIHIFSIKTRIPSDKREKDRLCLNMWLDENDLSWKKQSFYTAHEIAQIIPLVNKDGTYEKFLRQNRWVLKFWPSAVKIENFKLARINREESTNLFENFAYKLQLNHMKPKITHETITRTRALFHPQDWGKIVASRLSS